MIALALKVPFNLCSILYSSSVIDLIYIHGNRQRKPSMCIITMLHICKDQSGVFVFFLFLASYSYCYYDIIF